MEEAMAQFSQGLGYVILFGLSIMLILVATLAYKRFKIDNLDELLAGGRSLPLGIVSASICVSWIWTTTIMGSAEAGFTYGVTGGINYAWGAAVPFLALIPIALSIRKRMPKATTFTEFVEQRYGKLAHKVFFVFAIGITFYVSMEQAVGAAYLFNAMFGIPYWVVAVIVPLVYTSYISIAGLKGSIFNDVFQFLVISLVLFVVIPVVLLKLGPSTMYQNLVDVATNVQNPNYNPDVLNFFNGAGWRYGIAAVVIATGQIVLDQGYYQRAIAAATQTTLKKAYLLGGLFAWLPIPFVCGNVFGLGGLSLNLTPEISSQISPEVVQYAFKGGSLIFLLMVFMAAMTTGDTAMAGIQALLTVDVYKRNKKNATSAQQMRFGRLIIWPVGIGIAIFAVLMEGVSLLYIDIMSGIIFAAPVGVLLFGTFWERPSQKVAIISIFAGFIGGIAAWRFIPNQDINWFWGNVISLTVPIILLVILSLLFPSDFKFKSLEGYEGLIDIPESELEGENV
jgi:Na+/proline symporter